ncbi:putative ubiquitin-protein ligase [Talaromyces proteolyticus]|uniref:Ubiquitin-protein ligase n=1 Tax=Talaromyces proteolyticus TaxID=1131652 RepID=A0AAD4PZT2_9EURO|nr:putative ubiquitin-protein ligase [Talaromyces proteolyticus]KAH8696306.1 putative ubiquitin-protein ligase [Talaromyces proteolyticus]
MSATTPSMPAPTSGSVFANATTYNNGSLSPLALLKYPLHAIRQVEAFTFATLPQNVARLVGLDTLLDNGAGREGDNMAAAVVAAATTAGADRAAEGLADGFVGESSFNFTDILQAMRRFSGFFSYMTSRWSIACFSVALILNRVTIYASTRRHLSLPWHKRLALRIVPIIVFMAQILNLLRAMRCQTSPDYSSIRYGHPEKHFTFDHASEGGFIHALGSSLLAWETDQQSCSAVHMDKHAGSTDIPYGSFTLLWPVFMSLCLSHFVETLSCALQGRSTVTEAGMSIFEHSLAFAEAETMISQSIGLGMFGLSKSSSVKDDLKSAGEGSSALHLLTRTQVLERMNVTPELLLIILISCCNSLLSNVLDVVGKQSRYRLVNTTIWGLCFMGAMAWGFLDNRSFDSETGVLKFPTVCIVGFVPHLLILIGIAVCLCIYGLAVLITAFALPPDLPRPSTLWERFSWANENMQGSNQIRNVRLNMHEDFYTTLLRIGYAALTAASEAVFLNEGRSVVARRRTWLEDERLAEIETSRRRTSVRSSAWGGPLNTPLDNPSTFNFDISHPKNENWESGYKHEQKIEKLASHSRPAQSQTSLGGVGAFQGAARCYHGFAFFRGIFYLISRWLLLGLNKVLNRLGITLRPQWMLRFIGSNMKGKRARMKEEPASLDFWILTDDGELELPEDNEFDVEKEMRKREGFNQPNWGEVDEARLESKLYNWWSAGGSWGNQDESGDYVPLETDFDDTTSVISMQTNGSEWEDYDASDGRRTPTQSDPFPVIRSRESTPLLETLLDTSSLARLLDPRDQESKNEARILAAHLVADKEGRIMTRSRLRSQIESERARILLPARYQSSSSSSINSDKLRPTPEEEADILEKLIISRRHEAASQRSADGPSQTSWQTGAAGLGTDGPQCVICQTSPRSVITWPCRCLCVCEDCRVSLAMNNFGSCVTCRQEVSGFVRLWVP